jgi:hypothetical protein
MEAPQHHSRGASQRGGGRRTALPDRLGPLFPVPAHPIFIGPAGVAGCLPGQDSARGILCPVRSITTNRQSPRISSLLAFSRWRARWRSEEGAMAQFSLNPRRFDPSSNFKFCGKWEGGMGAACGPPASNK